MAQVGHATGGKAPIVSTLLPAAMLERIVTGVLTGALWMLLTWLFAS